MNRFITLVPILAMALAACAGPGLFASEPMGKQLDRVRKQLEDQCRADGTPPFGPNKPGQFETACLMFALKPWEIGDTPESAFAHSIKLPSPHDKPKNVYKVGMSSEEYFKELCEAEAGEWIFRRISGVTGIRQMRPPGSMLGYAPIVYYGQEPTANPIGTPRYLFDGPTNRRYNSLERRVWRRDSSDATPLYEYFDAATRNGRLTTTPTSNFAYVSRGLRRTHDREHALHGWEFILYQVEPFEVLGVQRIFSRFYMDRRVTDLRAPHVQSCSKSSRGPYDFLLFVLSPASKLEN